MAKKKKKGFFAKLATPFVKLGKAVVKLGNTVITAASFVVLAPFKGAMKKALDGKKIKYSNTMKDITDKFVKHVIKGNKNYEGTLLHFEDFEALENFRKLDEIDLDNYDSNENLEDPDHIAPAVGAIIAAVIDFFKNLKKKKESGAVMTPAENSILQVADEGSKHADRLIAEEQKKTVGGFVLDNKAMIFIAVAILVTFLAFGGGWKRA